MKKISIASLLTLLLAANAFAANVAVPVPFIHKAVPTEGLTMSYNTEGTEKIVCITDNFYKGYLTVTENGGEKDAGISFGNHDGSEFYFTSTGSDKVNNQVPQFHVDRKGLIKLKDSNSGPHEAYASCFYISEIVKNGEL